MKEILSAHLLLPRHSMRRLFQAAAWLLAVAIALLSLVPAPLRPVSDLPSSLEHFMIFLLTGLCFAIGYPGRVLFHAIGLVAFAGLVEIAQLWAPGRHSRLSDFIVDALAALIGVGVARLILRTRIGGILDSNSDSEAVVSEKK